MMPFLSVMRFLLDEGGNAALFTFSLVRLLFLFHRL